MAEPHNFRHTMRYKLATFGWQLTLQAYFAELLKRLFGIVLCTVYHGHNSINPPVPGYKLKMLDLADLISFDSSFADRFADAFARGDTCAGAIYADPDGGADVLASYNLFASSRTTVNDWVDFQFPAGKYSYSYATFTHPDHRGKKVAPSLWTFSREQNPHRAQSIFYIAMTNLPSIKAGLAHRTKVGYSAFKLVGRDEQTHALVFNSPGCRRKQVGFVATRAAPHAQD